MKTEILVPLLNANEPEARLVQIHVMDGQQVEKGVVLFTLETTKAAADVEAPESGYIRIHVREGDTFAVGDKLAVISEQLSEIGEQKRETRNNLNVTRSTLNGELRITKPARALAEQLGVGLALLPTDKLVTESVVKQFASKTASPAQRKHGQTASTPLLGNSILIYGGGGHAKTVMEMVQAMGTFKISGIIDDGITAGTSILGIPVLGGREKLSELAAQGVRFAANGVGGIINIDVRVRLFELLELQGLSLPALVHPRSTVERSAEIGVGVQVFANAYVGSSTILHPKCMVNTGAIVSHDCEIGQYTHIAPGAMLAGHVHVGARALVGMGVTTAIGIRIGSGARIGNGAILYADVPDKAIVPAGMVWGG